MNFFYKLVAMAIFVLVLSGCRHLHKQSAPFEPSEPLIVLKKREINVVFVPSDGQRPSYMVYSKKDRYAFKNMPSSVPFKKELLADPLMKNLNFSAVVEKKGKIVQQFVAQKNISPVLSNKKTVWSPTRPRQALIIPYVADDEEVVVSMSYEWMDSRFMPPLIMQEEPTLSSVVTIDVPHGTSMNFLATNFGEKFDFLPKNQAISNSIWSLNNKTGGLGTRYAFEKDWAHPAKMVEQGNRLQLLVSFEPPTTSETSTRFDSWTAVANYLAERFDRFDLASKGISDFANQINQEEPTTAKKIVRVLSFLQNEIESRDQGESFQNETLQTAAKTFAKRVGTAVDKAILGKSLFAGMDIRSELLAVQKKSLVPRLANFYTPALFSELVLAVKVGEKVLYFDPAHRFSRLDQLPFELQGQGALVLRKDDGRFYHLPYDPSTRHQKNFIYNLAMDEYGRIGGEYELSLNGLSAAKANERLVNHSALGADAIQRLFVEENENLFSWRTAKVQKDGQRKDAVAVFGEVTPRMLAKDNAGNFTIAMGHFFDPFLNMAQQNAQRFEPSSCTLTISIALPESFEVRELPPPIDIKQDGLSVGIYVKMEEESIRIEGHWAADGPFSNAILEAYAREIAAAFAVGKHKLSIEKAVVQLEEKNRDQQALAQESP